MSYKRFLTKGFILDSKAVGEDNLVLSIFTENLGMIKAKASGVRKSHSKMRPHLNIYAFGNYELIQGRNGWKVVGASAYHCFQFIWQDKNRAEPAARILFLLLQLVPETEISVDLFKELEQSFGCLANLKFENRNKGFLVNWEYLTVMRLLDRLGYLSFDKDLNSLVRDPNWKPELVKNLSPYRQQAAFIINQGLASSHLVRF